MYPHGRKLILTFLHYTSIDSLFLLQQSTAEQKATSLALVSASRGRVCLAGQISVSASSSRWWCSCTISRTVFWKKRGPFSIVGCISPLTKTPALKFLCALMERYLSSDIIRLYMSEIIWKSSSLESLFLNTSYFITEVVGPVGINRWVKKKCGLFTND